MTMSLPSQFSELTDEQRTALLSALRNRQLSAQTHEHQQQDPRRTTSRSPADDNVDAQDVIVLGGGIAGLSLALQLRGERPWTKITIIERTPYPVSEKTHKVGESTVEIAAHYLRDRLGLHDHLQDEQLRKFGLRMFFSSADNSDISDRRELGGSEFPLLATYQLDRGRLENELARRCRDGGIRLVQARVLEVELRPNEPYHRVRIGSALEQRDLPTRWIVDATGRSNVLQRSLGRRHSPVGHKANAAWFRLDHKIDINAWSDDQQWKDRISRGDRSLSTNHLMGDGYWVWLIRLASGATSVGIVASDEHHAFNDFNTVDRAVQWLKIHEPQCAAVVEEHRADLLDFRVMRDYAYTSEQVYSGAERWCVTGEAGVFLDPLYSPGLDHIAISNTLVADIVGRSLEGEDVTARASAHERVFLTVAEIWLAVYEQQYRLMGDPVVMSSKVIWDTAFYWGVFGLLFFQDGFQQLVDCPTIGAGLARLTELSNRIQRFFREWHSINHELPTGDFVDLYTPLNFMRHLHEGMAVTSTDTAELTTRFSENALLLEQLAGQLVDTVIRSTAERTDDATIALIQTWQRDSILTGAQRIYRQRRRHTPTSEGWIRLSVVPPTQDVQTPRDRNGVFHGQQLIGTHV